MAKSQSASQCPVTRGEVDLDYYASVDKNWCALGLPSPARRALINDELFTIKQLAKRTHSHIANLHGMGPKSVRILEAALKDNGLSFKKM